jgi:hypothetical protein
MSEILGASKISMSISDVISAYETELIPFVVHQDTKLRKMSFNASFRLFDIVEEQLYYCYDHCRKHCMPLLRSPPFLFFFLSFCGLTSLYMSKLQLFSTIEILAVFL